MAALYFLTGHLLLFLKKKAGFNAGVSQAIFHHSSRNLPLLAGLFSRFLAVSLSLLTMASLSAAESLVEFAEAIEKGDLKIVRKMLDDGLDPNIRTPESPLECTPLFLAVQSAHPSITAALLKAGADATMEDGNGDPVMVYAADAGREAHARLLIRHGVSIDSKNRGGITALLRGSPYEKGPDVQAKIDLGANPDLADPRGNTPLMRASEAANLEAMKVLIKAGAKLDVSNKAGENALTLALGRDYYGDEKAKFATAVTLLLKAGADINRRNSKGESVLLLALDSWNIAQETIEALLAAEPNIRFRDEDGRDALYHAVLDGKLNVHIERLLELGADLNTIDNEGTTLLMRAAGNYRPDLVRDFISQGLSAGAKNQSGRTAVHFASGAGRFGVGDQPIKVVGEKIVAVLELLHKHGASLTAADNDGETPLHLAAMAGIPEVISYLLPHYQKAEVGNVENETPLHFAAAYGPLEVVELLLPGCKNLELRDSRGHTALINASDGDHREIVLALLEAGADINAKDKDGTSSLSASFTDWQIDKLRFLVKHGADPKTLEDLDAKFLRAARLFHDEITPPEDYAFLVEFLAGLVTDVDHRDSEGMTALMWVAASNNEAALKSILACGPGVDSRSNDGRTALMWAACSGALDSMQILVAAGADESLRDPTGRTAAEWFEWTKADHQSVPLAAKGRPDLGERISRSRQIALQRYLKHGRWQKDDRVAGVPPLHLAAALGDVGAITTLIQWGAPINLTMTDGSTALIEAAANGQVKAVELLLEKGADPALRDSERQRALDYAVDFGQTDVLRIFLRRKIAFSNDESSLLRSLVYRGNETLLREFFRAGASVLPPRLRKKDEGDPFSSNSPDSSAVLTAAAIKSDSRMLRILLEFPVESGADDPTFLVSALHHAADRGRLENVKFLVKEQKVDLDVLLSDSFGGVTVVSIGESDDKGPQAVSGFSALSRALEEGHPDVVRYLVEQGATISGRTRGGGPPLTFVIEHLQDEMLRFFLKNDVPMELVDLSGQTALHCAVASNRKLAVRLLLEHGANPKAKTPKGLTPLDLARKREARDVIPLLESASQ